MGPIMLHRLIYADQETGCTEINRLEDRKEVPSSRQYAVHTYEMAKDVLRSTKESLILIVGGINVDNVVDQIRNQYGLKRE